MTSPDHPPQSNITDSPAQSVSPIRAIFNILVVLLIIGLISTFLWTRGNSAIFTDTYISAFDPGSTFQSTVSNIDKSFEKAWQNTGTPPVDQADDLIIARRLSLALTGTIPSLEEIRAFEQQPEDQRIQWWLSKIFEDRRWSDYVAERLARSYVGTEGGPFSRLSTPTHG